MEEIKRAEEPSEILEYAKEQAEGSAIGKFKSATERDAAYAALEKEFTRRSQQLRELERENMELREMVDGAEQADREVMEFLAEFPDAQSYAQAMADALREHPEWEGPMALTKAYLTAVSAARKTPEEMLADGSLSARVLADPGIREAILREYISSMPIAVRLPMGRGIPASKGISPSSIQEAGELLANILK